MFVWACLFFSPPARPTLAAPQSQHRVALVIGNGAYREIKSLDNPVNDAKLMAATLRTLGFEVIERFDRTKEQLESDFALFTQRLRTGSVALLYYAGHGVQYGGRNYLIGTDMSGRFDQANATQGLLDIGAATRAVAEKSGLSIIILDACRNPAAALLKNNPGLADGFTEFANAPAGTFVAYSTSPGKTAYDGVGYENSFYTASLAANLKMVPSRIEDVFRRTQVEVEQNTRDEAARSLGESKGTQVPWTASSLKTLFYFTPDEVAASPVPQLFPASSLKSVLMKMGALKSATFPVPRINERGTPLQQLTGRAGYFVEDLRGAALEMSEIPGGRFLMGAGAAEVGQAFEEAVRGGEILDEETYLNITAEMPQHAVNVNGFFMSRYEITQAQYAAVMGRAPNVPTQFSGPNFPVVNVTWNEANEFCARLSRLTGRQYRLPTEAEWEYAARAGTTTPFAFGATITPLLAVYNGAVPFGPAPRGPRRDAPARVGEISPANAFGLFDMHGNVWEWCADYWHSSYTAAPTNGSAWDEPELIADESDP
jgi:formylglycine-generating enzyme required for sulfatase activity